MRVRSNARVLSVEQPRTAVFGGIHEESLLATLIEELTQCGHPGLEWSVLDHDATAGGVYEALELFQLRTDPRQARRTTVPLPVA